MKLELEYSKNFDDAWDEQKEEVKREMDKLDCIDTENNIKWPCWVCIFKREKEYYSKH